MENSLGRVWRISTPRSSAEMYDSGRSETYGPRMDVDQGLSFTLGVRTRLRESSARGARAKVLVYIYIYRERDIYIYI